MILSPPVLALQAGAAASSGFLLYALRWAAPVVRRWDPASGSRAQLRLERRALLVGVLVRTALAVQLASLALFVHASDALAPMFTGAMCAAGTLSASPYGWPALAVQVAATVLAGAWLALDRADGLAPDQPLVRVKHALLPAVAIPVVAGAALQAAHFLALRPEIITSCCGSLFGREGRGGWAGLAWLPARTAGALLVAVPGAAALAALVLRRTGRGAWAVAALSALAGPAAAAGVIAWVSPYVYEAPGHRCPFCLLQPEQGWVGYPLHAALLAGCVAGVAVGVLQPFRRVPSLAAPLPALQRRLAGAAALAWVALLAGAAALVAASGLHA
ncbi:hypothetical protein [Anaeromyxobacter sp. PSR-1]|uniref:hypothetical protein n=1 Tax=Anaeromyxobacter sp. PSR-1 TaxID=1300915 RepID=UPI0005E8079A|nr:hypothetical protein [Anaeromyxobacter sp. PSR-1]GAO05479.1 hypothetical protein PSR1_04393 [Anaeromyxobacter sp. PSR-1]